MTTLFSNAVTFHMSTPAKEVMRITADAVTVAPDVSVNEAAIAVIAALEQHMRNIVAAEREACAKLCDEMERQAEGTECCKWPTPGDCAAVIRARGQA